MEERQAIIALKQGDLHGLETLVELHQQRAVEVAYLIVRDRATAEDVVQNAFIRAAEKIQQFDLHRPFGPWFFRIVSNLAVKTAQRDQSFVSLEDDVDPEIASLAISLADDRPLPEEMVERAELRQLVWQALARLKPEQRAVIVMRHFQEMSEAEMVTHLQRPNSTIKWWLHTARKRLKEILRLHLMAQAMVELPPGEPAKRGKETRDA